MNRFASVFCAAAAVLAPRLGFAGPAETPIPRLVHENGRYALFVDGAPFLMLGAQVHNSSGWPAMLPKVWASLAYLHANTAEIPVYWEQIEPEHGVFIFNIVDTLIRQAREHHIRLVLLWFATWKNGSGHYWPEWMKRRRDLYPTMVSADGHWVDSPSPHSEATLHADIAAFKALMGHLKQADPQHTVIMVQVENEPGTWGGTVRDHSPAGDKLFARPAPASVLAAMGVKPPVPNASWLDAFGPDADEYFHAFSVASYIGQVAAAGKAVYPLPLYVNVALRDPIKPGPASTYESGGATDNVIPIWKAAAPAIDLLAPDIYQRDTDRYLKVLDLYQRPDNALFVPETIGAGAFSRFFYSALGKGAIGFSPFGVDSPRVELTPSGAVTPAENPLAGLARAYQVIGPMDREVARWNFEGKLKAVAEIGGQPSEKLNFGDWDATVAYGAPRFGDPVGNPQPTGRAMIAQIAPDQFIVTGSSCRVIFRPVSGRSWQYLRVEEGQYDQGVFVPIRIWNGDETDWGLNFGANPVVLRVAMLSP